SGSFTQRKGASLSLSAITRNDVGNYIDAYGNAWQGSRPAGLFELAQGAKIRVDDGQSVSVAAAERMRIEGAIEARGGKVT
ncbi:hypothetical protein NL329_30885, partial [Klebsiella pneumoniae]|nr:hypothetical protein [Klebsiella pneumoniae]